MWGNLRCFLPVSKQCMVIIQHSYLTQSHTHTQAVGSHGADMDWSLKRSILQSVSFSCVGFGLKGSVVGCCFPSYIISMFHVDGESCSDCVKMLLRTMECKRKRKWEERQIQDSNRDIKRNETGLKGEKNVCRCKTSLKVLFPSLTDT